MRDGDRVVVVEVLGEPHGTLSRGEIQQVDPPSFAAPFPAPLPVPNLWDPLTEGDSSSIPRPNQSSAIWSFDGAADPSPEAFAEQPRIIRFTSLLRSKVIQRISRLRASSHPAPHRCGRWDLISPLETHEQLTSHRRRRVAVWIRSFDRHLPEGRNLVTPGVRDGGARLGGA